MVTVAKRKTSLSLDAEMLDLARELEINVSAIADAALRKAVLEARRKQWLDENAEAFAAQSEWHAKNGHPAAEIIVSPGAGTWRG